MNENRGEDPRLVGEGMDPQSALSYEAVPETDRSTQIQNRLLHLAGQLDLMQTGLDQLGNNVQDHGTQLEALLRAFLTTQGGEVVFARLAELMVQIEATREQVEQTQRTLAAVATQEQVSRLERLLAESGLLADMAESVKKLGRTQFKANTLGETREQQIETALSLARELVIRHEQAHELRGAEERLRLEELRSTARGELAADLLPALDSIELALDTGRALLTRHRQQLADARTRFAAAQRNWEAEQRRAVTEEPAPQAQPVTLWERLRRSLGGERSSAGPPPTAAALPPATTAPATTPPAACGA